MNQPHKPRVRAKVCGVMSPADAQVVAAAGAWYMGVILTPGFSRSVPSERVREIYAAAPAQRVGVFVNAKPQRMAAAARAFSLDVVQLSGGEPVADAAAIAAAGPWRVWKTVHAKPGVAVGDLIAPYRHVVDGVTVDSWDPAQPGGTGRSFAWGDVGRQVREAIGSATFIAAGGMNPENASLAVATLSPDVLDVSSGVESTHGVKDPARTRAFVKAVQCTHP